MIVEQSGALHIVAAPYRYRDRKIYKQNNVYCQKYPKKMKDIKNSRFTTEFHNQLIENTYARLHVHAPFGT